MRHIFSFLRVALLIYIYIAKILLQINGSCRTFEYIDKRLPSNFDRNSINVLFNVAWSTEYSRFSIYLSIFLTYVLACVPTTAFSTIRISNSYREQGDGRVEKSTHTHTRNRNLHIYHEFMGDIWFSYFHYFLVRDKRNTCEPITVWIISHEYDRINHIIMEVIW